MSGKNQGIWRDKKSGNPGSVKLIVYVLSTIKYFEK